jgi:hypothetical protein
VGEIPPQAGQIEQKLPERSLNPAFMGLAHWLCHNMVKRRRQLRHHAFVNRGRRSSDSQIR